MLHICVAHVSPHVHMRVLHVYTYVCYKHVVRPGTHMCVCLGSTFLVSCSTHLETIHALACSRHLCSRTTLVCTQVHVPGTHVCYQMNTRVCVCVCVRVPGAHKCVRVRSGRIPCHHLEDLVVTAGGTRGPGRAVANEDPSLVPWKRTCL